MQNNQIESLFKQYQLNCLAEESFYEFYKQAWPTIAGDIPFVDGWHTKAIADHLQAAYERRIKRLLINVPPRSGKTSICSIAFPAWVWLKNASESFMYASHSIKLSLDQSTDCRRLIESEWYQSKWGDLFKLSRDQNTKTLFSNSKLGSRRSTSVGSRITGTGASFLIQDDPNAANNSALERQNVINFWTQVWSSRLNDPKKDVKIVVQQRLHEEDLTGYILNNEEGWVKLIIPMEFESHRKTKTITLQGVDWEDPRETEGELLSPGRFGEKEVKEQKKRLGIYGYAGQYQQRPSPVEGGIFKRDWFCSWTKKTLPQFLTVIQSWDTAFTNNKKSDWSVCTTWGIFSSSQVSLFQEGEPFNVAILISLWKGQVLFPELRERAVRLSKNYMDVFEDEEAKRICNKPCDILIEEKGSGLSLIQDLHNAGIPNIIKRNPIGDKIGRAHLTSHLVEGNLVYLAKDPQTNQLKRFAKIFTDEILLFPRSKNDDIVDTFTQFLVYAKETGLLKVPTDPVNESFEWDREEVKFF